MPGGRPAIPVLLLKTKSCPEDGYEQYFRSEHNRVYEPTFVPVLEHTFNKHAIKTLKSYVLQRCLDTASNTTAPAKFGGIIFTSQRAVEAFAQVVDDLRKRSQPVDEILPESLYLYVVGPATARALRALGLKSPVIGDQSGNGEALASFILEHYRQSAKTNLTGASPKAALLFLVGEQRRDIIPKILQSESLSESERIRVEEMTVYGTGIMESFREDFGSAVTPALTRRTLQWVIVFSPTGCRAMLECLGLLDEASGKSKPTGWRGLTRIGTIGPTTRDYLIREFNFQPDVCAGKPSPEGLGAAIEDFMKSCEETASHQSHGPSPELS